MTHLPHDGRRDCEAAAGDIRLVETTANNMSDGAHNTLLQQLPSEPVQACTPKSVLHTARVPWTLALAFALSAAQLALPEAALYLLLARTLVQLVTHSRVYTPHLV